jgi:hypothetical protein
VLSKGLRVQKRRMWKVCKREWPIFFLLILTAAPLLTSKILAKVSFFVGLLGALAFVLVDERVRLGRTRERRRSLR